jgi:hypothetical protein
MSITTSIARTTRARVQTPPAVVAVVLPDQVKGADDKFECPKIHGTVSARECKTRYKTAHEDVGGRPSGPKSRRRLAVISAAPCKGCELGPTTIHPKVSP